MAKEKQNFLLNYLLEGLDTGVDEEVEMVKNTELRNLQSRRKLCLVLDLDHTLLHTKNFDKLSSRQKLDMSHYEGDDIFEWELLGEKFITKLRPFVRQFLKEASEMFELYVYTMGSRKYAFHIVDEFLDPQGVYFGERVIGWEDCTVEGQKGLDVVHVHPSAVIILDDTESVWKRNFGNLIVVDKYCYFSGVGRDESEGEEELRYALQVLTQLHTLYFQCYDRFTDDDVRELDVRELMEIFWEDIMDEIFL